MTLVSIDVSEEDFRVEAVVVSSPSKPMTQRCLIAAALARGTTILRNVLLCSETRAMMRSLSAMGADFCLDGDTVTVTGVVGRIGEAFAEFGRQRDSFDPSVSAPAMEADGSALVLRVMVALASSSAEPIVVGGNPRLNRRPLRPLLDALVQLGADVQVSLNDHWIDVARVSPSIEGFAPVRIRSGARSRTSHVILPANVSSQFITALLFAIPAMPASGGMTPVEIELQGRERVFSASYVRQTVDVLRTFGIAVEMLDARRECIDVHDTSCEPRFLQVAPAQLFVAPPRALEIEGDYTSASYLMATIAIHRGRLIIRGLRSDSLQGERYMVDVMKELLGEGAVSFAQSGELILENENGIDLRTSHEFDVTDAPNITPALMAIAASGPEELRMTVIGADLTRFHKSERVDAMAAALHRAGVPVAVLKDGVDSHSRGFEITRRGGLSR